MIVNCVTVYVKEDHIRDFIEASSVNHRGTIAEPGNLRFDVLQCTDDPTRFFLYEAFESLDAVKAHKETSHYLVWRDTVAPWMARPREGVSYTVICPSERSMW